MSTTKALIMLVITSVAGILWWQMPAPSSSGPEFIFSSNRTDPIEAITFDTADGSSEIYPVENKKWVLRKPDGAAANPGAVRQVLVAISKMRAENTVTEEGVESFGLEKPELLISVRFKGSVTAVRFGNAHPFSNRRYARREGDNSVFLVDASLFEMLRSSVKEIRDVHPFFFDVDTATRIEVVENSRTHRLFRRGEKWEIEGRSHRLSGDDILARLRQLASLKVKRFIDELGTEGDAAFGLKPPRVTLTVHRSGADPVVIEFGEVRSATSGKFEFFARIPGLSSVFELPGRMYTDFLRPEEAFSDRHAFAELTYDKVRLVCIRSGSRENGIQRRGGEWVRTSSCSSESPGKVIRNGEQAVRELLQFQVLSFIPPTAVPLTAEGVSADKRFISPTGAIGFNGGESEVVFGAEVEGEGEQPPRYAKIVAQSSATRIAIVNSFDVQQILRIVK